MKTFAVIILNLIILGIKMLHAPFYSLKQFFLPLNVASYKKL